MCSHVFLHFWGVKTMDPMQGPCAKSHHLSSVHHIPMTIEDFEVAIVPRKADGMRRAPYHIQSRHQKKCPAWKNIRFLTGDKRKIEPCLKVAKASPKRRLNKQNMHQPDAWKPFNFNSPLAGYFVWCSLLQRLMQNSLAPLKVWLARSTTCGTSELSGPWLSHNQNQESLSPMI